MRISEKIAEFSQNLIATAADLVLFKIYLGADWKLMGESDGEGTWEGLAGTFVDLPAGRQGLPELTPAKTLRALRLLLKQGYIELAPQEAHLVPQITEAGGKRLDEIFPVYQKERPWDGKFYLVNYDIPVGKNSQRDALRNFLKDELGCVMLQSSVWLTPYDPTKALGKFVEKRNLTDSVVVSVLLEDWAPASVAEIYGLGEINKGYRGFTEKYGGDWGDRGPAPHGVRGKDKMELAFEYFAILRDDPQLPFELLPEDWAGAQAQEVFEKLFFGK
jgi:DNA-binding transcriptional regulator PaaX